MTWYKFLARGALGPFSGYTWPAPDGLGHPGEWLAATRLEPCRSGLHLLRPEDLPYWLCEELYTVEVEGEVVPHGSFVLARRARLVDRVGAWRQDAAVAFCEDCTVRVRDLAVEALRAEDRLADAGRLAACGTTEEIQAVAERIAEDTDEVVSPLMGYALDAAKFTDSARSSERWAAGTATTAFVTAKAAAVAADGSAGHDATAAERRRQGEWLASHLLVAH
ncbi:hypothetical protein K1X13_17215 [Nocardioides sp. WL0053]|uniref:Uncharacterized protein n=1 Tax=Nocardioides jiangsuensis TaxID=2866161 RepID=A0ABS7RNE8_9ACTN|nr:hypothetical protein [Nocardioides jiangsuensis]MBY9076578.1 hypothetical protein [Nocardioides jiangsuensis]